jgi:glutamine amidotransferase
LLGAGAERDPVDATLRTLARLAEIVDASGTTEPLRFTAALTNGRDIYAFRYADKANRANTLYYREAGDSIVMASEPLDTQRDFWKPVPAGHYLVARAGAAPVLETFAADAPLAAAE